MKIGQTEIKHGLFLAPMAGYTDHSMRVVCHEAGAEYSVSEMVSAKAVTFNDKKTFSLAKIFPDEGPVAIQIFGSEPSVMAEAARLISENEACSRLVAIDINMGCPVKKIFSNGEGSALMKSPSLIEKITSAVKRAVNIPVTVKIRTGVDPSHINAVECALAAESGGADALCIHGRTTKQMYGGKADRKIIEKVKSSLQIPIIANGDITNAEEALSMFSDTGADGIAIGRGAVGNPFIFCEIRSALENKFYTKPTLKDRIDTALRQLSIATCDKGERLAVIEARGQIALYLKGFSGAARIRCEINRAETLKEVEKSMLTALNENK
ncbi:MAG: tRNA dihydrouridine synthase DusB [Clostridia bacterium]|nr:tRNA dihydrouridine synthase DusB [Clostridia bacterium]